MMFVGVISAQVMFVVIFIQMMFVCIISVHEDVCKRFLEKEFHSDFGK